MFRNLELVEADSNRSGLSVGALWFCALLIAVTCGALIAAIVLSPKAPPELAALIASALPRSGVENPVTAVLLNFRSYDTLLEIAVLLIVAVAMVPGRTRVSGSRAATVNTDHNKDPMLTDLVRWLVPIAVLVSGSLLWSGAYAPSGAFQAGAVLASACIAVVLAQNHSLQWQSHRARGSLVIGLMVFVAVAIACVAITGTLLQYPGAHAASYILFIEIALTLSIAATLLLLFTCLSTTSATVERSMDGAKTGHPA